MLVALQAREDDADVGVPALAVDGHARAVSERPALSVLDDQQRMLPADRQEAQADHVRRDRVGPASVGGSGRRHCFAHRLVRRRHPRHLASGGDVETVPFGAAALRFADPAAIVEPDGHGLARRQADGRNILRRGGRRRREGEQAEQNEDGFHGSPLILPAHDDTGSNCGAIAYSSGDMVRSRRRPARLTPRLRPSSSSRSLCWRAHMSA